MLWIRILREHDEVARIVSPIAQAMTAERAPHGDCLRRGLDPREGVSESHTPPTHHDDLHSRSNGRGTRPYTGSRRGSRRGIMYTYEESLRASRKEGVNRPPSVGIRCWPSPGSSDGPGARGETLHRHIEVHSRTGGRPS